MSWKSKKKAEATKEAAGTSNQPVDCPAQCCPGQTHFFKLKVQDSDGQPAPMVKPTIALNDGSTLTGVVLDAQGEFTTGNVLDLTSECKVSLPELYDADWWPEGSSPGNVSTNQSLTIAEGDCVVKLAQDNGFLDYQSIWGQSANEPLRKKHPNPNSLLVGDQLAAPDTKTRVVPSPVDQTCKFVIRASKPPKLRVVLVDKQQKPLDGCEWEITEPTALKGKTDATGLIQIDPLDPSYVAGKLKAKVKKPAPPPPPAAPPPPPANPPRYPPPSPKRNSKTTRHPSRKTQARWNGV